MFLHIIGNIIMLVNFNLKTKYVCYYKLTWHKKRSYSRTTSMLLVKGWPQFSDKNDFNAVIFLSAE